MNEDRHKLRLSKPKERKRHGGWTSYWIKPVGKFWKRLFNKRVRTNKNKHKRGNWLEWL